MLLKLLIDAAIVCGGDREPEVLLSLIEHVIVRVVATISLVKRLVVFVALRHAVTVIVDKQHLISFPLNVPVVLNVLPLLLLLLTAGSLPLHSFLLFAARKLHLILEFLIFHLLVLCELFFQLIVVPAQAVMLEAFVLLDSVSESALFFYAVYLSLDLFFSVPEEQLLNSVSFLW